MRPQRHTPTRSMNTIKVGSLFSGYGGLDLAVHMAIPDTRTVWVSDVEPGPNKILAERFPNAPNLGDITTIDWVQVEPVDILVGSSPCQDLSTAGQRAGMKPGTRSGLWESMTHAIHHLHPQLVVWENVLGALSASAYSRSDVEPGTGPMGNEPDGPVLRALGRVLGDLTNLGYDAQWATVRAADVGAPHGRRRVFVVAYPTGDGLEGGFTGGPLSELPPTESNEPLLPTPTVGDKGGTEARSGEGFGAPLGEVARLLRTPCAAEADGGLLHPDVARDRNQTLRLSGQILALTGDLLPTPQARDGKGVPGDGFNLASLPREIALLPTPTAERPDGRKSDAFREGRTMFYDVVELNQWGVYAPAIHRWENILGRSAPDPTEPNPRTGKPQISPAFVEWMMGLPQGWVTDVDISRANQLRALGNGVVPQQGAAAITRLLGRK